MLRTPYRAQRTPVSSDEPAMKRVAVQLQTPTPRLDRHPHGHPCNAATSYRSRPHLMRAKAAVRGIAAGSDIALIQGNPKKMIRAINQAIKKGKISRAAAAVASARRIISVQSRF